MSVLARETLRLSFALLVASVALIGAALAGIGGSLPLAVVFLGTSLGLYAVRDRITDVDPVWRYDPRPYLRVLWTGPLVAAAVVVVQLGATPGELQALGGLCGLVGMVNYFLRPVYELLTTLVRRLRRSLA